MRSPEYLNPPYISFPFSLENTTADQAAHNDQSLKLFFSSSVPNGSASFSLSFPAFFDFLSDQSGISCTGITAGDQTLVYNQRANNSIWEDKTSYDQVCSSSSLVQTDDSNGECHKLSACTTDQRTDTHEDHEISNTNRPVNWTPSTTELMIQKMTNQPDQLPENIPVTSKFQTARCVDQHRETNTGETSSSSLFITNKKSSGSCGVSAARVCSDCSTSTTPLWRSGPRGPKSLCNACGIRQRKARRSMAEAAAAASAATGLGGGKTGTATSATAAITAKLSSMSKGKKKKLPQNHNVMSCKNKRKLIMTYEEGAGIAAPSKNCKRKDKQLCDFKQVAAFPASVLFPLDVEEAAILLMNLSSVPKYEL